MEMKFERIANPDHFQSHRWMHTLADVPQVAMTEQDYKIVPITTKDADKVLDHLRKFFFVEEPLNIFIKLTGDNGDEPCKELESYCVKTIPEGLSLMAVSPTGKVIGVSLNGSHEPGHLDEMQSNADNCPHLRFRKILQLLVTVEREADVFKQFPDVDKLVEVRILSVDSSMRGKGIAKALLEKSRDMAKQLGYPLFRVDCTSHFSARAVARLGCKCIYSLPYEKYRKNGEQVFRPALPHKAVESYVQRLSS